MNDFNTNYTPYLINGSGKIDVIKRLRQFMQDTYGVQSGLKETKEFADSYFNSHKAQTQDKAIKQMQGAVHNLRVLGLDPHSFI